jgi:hypothetical protein
MTRLGDVITCSGYVVRKYEEAGKGYIEAQVLAVDATGDCKVAGSFIATLPLRALV